MANNMKTEQQLQGEQLALQARIYQLDRERAALLRQLELTEAALGGMMAERQSVAVKAAETAGEPRLQAVQ